VRISSLSSEYARYTESREEDLCKRTLRIRTACLCALRCAVATLIQNRRELFHTREFAASQSQLTLTGPFTDRTQVPHREYRTGTRLQTTPPSSAGVGPRATSGRSCCRV
jgi:hypothetical protein